MGRAYVNMQPRFWRDAGRIAVAIWSIGASTTGGLIRAARRLCELPHFGERYTAGQGPEHGSKTAAGRWGTSIIADPKCNDPSFGIVANVLGGDYERATLLPKFNSRAIHAGTIAAGCYRICPCEQISLLLGQQSAAFFLIKKDDGVNRKAFAFRRRYCRRAVTAPDRGCIFALHLAIPPPVEENREAESRIFESVPLA